MVNSTLNCPYCAAPAALVTGEVIYPHRADLAGLMFWRCSPCDAYVGCHKPDAGHGDGTRPYGRLANAQLRSAKVAAHAAFDPLWGDGRMSRRAAYAWLAEQLDIAVDACHIGAFDVAQCEAVVAAVARLGGELPSAAVNAAAPAKGYINSAMADAFSKAIADAPPRLASKPVGEQLCGIDLPAGWRWRYAAGSSVCVVVGAVGPESANVCIDFKRRIFGLGAQPPLVAFNDVKYIGNGWGASLVRDAVSALANQ